MEQNFMKKRYVSLLQTSKFSDCYFIINDEKILSHKVVLASCSPVFEAMLYGPLASSEIIINDILASEFKQMLTFIYTDYVQISSVVNAWSLVYIAKKYLIEDLLYFCLSYINKQLEAGNIFLNYEFADLFNEEDIRNICMNNMKMYAKVILNCDYHMKPSTLCNLLEQNDFNANEEELISATINWAKMECTEQNLEISKENIRTILKKSGAISRLRFLCLPAEEIYKLCEVLYDDEISYLKSCKLDESSENLYKLQCLNFCVNSSPRNSIQLLQKMGFRRVLKIGNVYYASVESKLTTQIVVNKCVLVNGFLLPSRRPPETCPSSNYTEHLNITITDVSSKRVVGVTYADTVSYGTNHTVKISEPFLFEAMKKYDIDITWSSNFLEWSNEYMMNYFSSLLINKDIKFEFNDPFDCGFIQGVCYCPFS